jgi:hypothetical protein
MMVSGGAPAQYRVLSYEEWLESEAGVRLEPGQRELVRVGLDGRAPKPLDPDWRSPVLGHTAQIFGFSGAPSTAALKTFAEVIGVRSGKSRIGAALHAVYQADTVPLYPDQVAPGEEVYCSFYGPKQAKAVECMAYALGCVRSNPRLRARIVGRVPEHNTAESFVFRSMHGAPIRFVAQAAGSGNISARGRYHLNNVLEEYGLFKTGEYAVNDKDIYDGVKTRLWDRSGWRYGRQQVIGSPWAEEGHLFELFSENWLSPHSAVVAQASTDVIRNDPNLLEMVGRMADEYRARGEWDVFLREFGARFLPLGSVRIYDDATLRQCGESARGDIKPGDVVVVGVDLGLVHDHAAIVVVRVRTEPVPGASPGPDGKPVTRRRYAVVDCEEIAPDAGVPLQPSKVCARFVEVMRRYGAAYAMADQYYRESVREAVEGAVDARGKPLQIVLTDSPRDEIATHMTARLIMGEGKVDLLKADQALMHQLGLVKRKPSGARRWGLDIPRGKTSGHCDLAEAAARALYQAHGVSVEARAPKRGTDERVDYDAEKWEERRAKQLQQQARR